MHSTAATILADAGHAPERVALHPALDPAIRAVLAQRPDDSTELTAVRPSPEPNAQHPFAYEDQPSRAWGFPDGSILLYADGLWLATDTTGRDPHGVSWQEVSA